jgi:hypothetical protein
MIRYHNTSMKKDMNPAMSGTFGQAEDFSAFSLAPQNFQSFYNRILGLRFPIDVAQVLEMRYLINHAVDRFHQPPLTPDYRQLREALQGAIDSFSIDKKHHRERLLKTLTMLRELHYIHSVNSRNAEVKMRGDLTDNRTARNRSMRYGLFCTVVTIVSSLLWLSLTETGWWIKLLTAASAYLAWDYFRSLSTLDREMEVLTLQLNDLLRRRVRSLNWKTLIHKLSLILGFKHVPGVEVFVMDHSGEYDRTQPTQH